MAGQQISIRNRDRLNRCSIFVLAIWNFGFLALLVLPAILSEVGLDAFAPSLLVPASYVFLEGLFVPWLIGAMVLAWLVLVTDRSHFSRPDSAVR